MLGGQVKAEFGGLALERSQFALPLLGFIPFGADVFKRHFILKHKVDGASDLVGGGDERLSGTELSTLAAVEGAEGGVGAGNRSGGLTAARGLTASVGSFEGAGAQHFAAAGLP